MSEKQRDVSHYEYILLNNLLMFLSLYLNILNYFLPRSVVSFIVLNPSFTCFLLHFQFNQFRKSVVFTFKYV